MDKPNDGGPAFPSTVQEDIDCCPRYAAGYGGMSLRDYFAGQALAGILADPERHGFNESHAECEFFVAEDAYILADAMITLRERERS